MTEEDLEVLLYGNPQLRRVSQEVQSFDDQLVELAQRMQRSMIAERGIGLAAPQVGRHIRLLLAENRGSKGPEILCLANPEILDASSEQEKLEEGCLSLPEIFAEVTRPVRVRVRYQDLEGNEQELQDDGLLARIIQHEMDHLEGVLFVDHLSLIKRKMLAKRLKNLTRRAADQRPL